MGVVFISASELCKYLSFNSHLSDTSHPFTNDVTKACFEFIVHFVASESRLKHNTVPIPFNSIFVL